MTLSDDEISAGLGALPGWERQGDEIVKEYKFPRFMDAIGFVGWVADAAEAADHHPDIDIRYNKVRLALSTHSAGGLTEKDLNLAREIETGWTPPS